jgi:hypothetical protein
MDRSAASFSGNTSDDHESLIVNQDKAPQT